MVVAIGLMILIAALHVYFMILESFLWERPSTRAKFGMTAEQAATCAVMAKNQGLYNFFLAAGLIFSLFHYDSNFFAAEATFFLLCVVAAGIVGAVTANRRIFFIQALPAIIALLALWI